VACSRQQGRNSFGRSHLEGPTAWTGRRRPAKVVPRRGWTSWTLEMAHSLISTGLLEIISNRRAENAKRPGRPPFSDVQGHFHGDGCRSGGWNVNAGKKMQRRAGVKMHHGGMPEGPPREDFYFGLKPGVGCRSAQLLVAGADVACSASADSCRRSFRGCGRGGSAGRVAHRSAARSRRPHDASFFERVVRRTCVLNSTICVFERLICQGIPLVIWWPDNRPF